MADRFYGDIFANTTSVSIPVLLRSSADNSPYLNAQPADVTCVYYRQGDPTVVVFPAVALGAANSAWEVGGWRVINDSVFPSWYRLDVPNGAWASGADWVGIQVRDATGSGVRFFNYDALYRINSQALIRVGLVS